MDSRHPNRLLLLLSSLLHFWQCTTGQSSYIIDSIGLTILPSSTVDSGTPVTLHCKASVSHDTSLHLTQTFLFRRNGVTIHTATTTDDTVLYELGPARAADSGNYECQVTVKEKHKTSVEKTLTVTGLQTPILQLNKITLFESEEVIATCSAPGEKGSLIFNFYQRFRTGEPQQIKRVVSQRNASETKLALRHIGDSHLYCDYGIALVPDAGHSNHSNEIQVIVRALYISPIMNILPSSKVYEGDIIEVVCKVVSALRDVEVFLIKDKTVLKKAEISLSHRFTAQEHDTGELVCKAEWNNVQKETYQAISVSELFSKPHLTLEPTNIFEGDRFKLTCSVSIYVPERIRNETLQFAIYKDKLKISNEATYTGLAQPNGHGNYTCKIQASSLGHSFVKESQTLVIKAKVPVSKPVLSVVGHMLVLGKPFQLLCHSDSGTLPIEYTLHGPGRLPERKVLNNTGERAIFNTSAITSSSDLNRFLCHAKNKQGNPPVISGQQLLRSTKIIEPVSVPLLTTVPNIDEISEGQDVTLYCSVLKGTPPITFTWYHTETKEALSSQSSPKLKAAHVINNVQGAHRGGYYCVSNNQASESKQSATVKIGVKLAGWKKGLIAVFCILLILALILVIAFRKRLLHFKRKGTAELSVKSASTKTERLSLTQAEVNNIANVTPGMMGKSVWSEHVSGSESDDQNSVTSPEKLEPQYTEVQTKQADPTRAPVTKGTDTVYSEVRNSKHGVPEQTDGGSVEYAQLNHDAQSSSDHGNHDNHAVQDDHLDEIDNVEDVTDADH
ncbi:platelet endothelial cell adhesion molecule isoform X2 [Sphaeramia orbicularis]|uniref:platelet endothelial cell adhesion molecule isoform X2 n=1 Tax=Sphaeramia orbicularis TaxID=375764 RepID=UPI0011803D59|nr:platelet endothelial cell adhesion molecule-like isoform X2 [Sphaeramia orbicularis]